MAAGSDVEVGPAFQEAAFNAVRAVPGVAWGAAYDAVSLGALAYGLRIFLTLFDTYEYSHAEDNLVVEVSALPKDIPVDIEIDVSSLEAGGSIRAKDLPLPDGVSLSVDPELFIIRVTGGK